MENKTLKASVERANGEVAEITGEGIIAIGLTEEDGGVRVQSDVEGMFSTRMIASAIRSMEGTFGEKWAKALAIVTILKGIKGEEPEEDPIEEVREDDGLRADK